MIDSGIKRGTAELAILSILGNEPVHGYEIARRIEQQTKGALRFTLASLSPPLPDGESGLGSRQIGGKPKRSTPPLLSPYRVGQEESGASTLGMGGSFSRLAPSHQGG